MERFWQKSWPENRPFDIEVPDTTINEVFASTAAKYPNSPAFILMGRKLSYREIDKLSSQFANALIEFGIEKGDRIAVMLPNVPQFPIVFYGIFKAGAIVSPINPLFKEMELRHQLKNTEARLLVSMDLFSGVVERGRTDTYVERVLYTRIGEYLPPIKAQLGRLVGKIPYPVVPTAPDIELFKDFIAGKSTASPQNRLGPDDVAVLLYTGGTTGLPKGAMLTHRNLIFNAKVGREWFAVHEGDECLIAVLPFFHAFGLSCVLVLSTYIGASIVLIPKPDIKQTIQSIEEYKATVLVGVPALYVSMLSSPHLKGDSLASLRHAFSGAAPLPLEVLERFRKATGVYLVEGYGMTETSPIQSLIPEGVLKPGSVGLPVFNTDIKIVDELDDTRERPAGEWGEILCRGPQVMAGYWRQEEETESTLKGGWMHTGDIGRFDADGYLYIGDRKKDLIKYKGYSVFPAEVEDMLYRHPAVAECAVIGVPDSTAGENIKAFITLKPEHVGKVSEDEIREWAKANMAAYKYPREVMFVPTLPKSAVGKILRRELRKQEGT